MCVHITLITCHKGHVEQLLLAVQAVQLQKPCFEAWKAHTVTYVQFSF